MKQAKLIIQRLNPGTATLSSWKFWLEQIYFLCRKHRAWLWKAEELFKLSPSEVHYLEELDDLFTLGDLKSLREFLPSYFHHGMSKPGYIAAYELVNPFPRKSDLPS